MLDYHVHSTFSIDCETPLADSCRAAIAAGVTEIAFTDHVDHVPADPGRNYYRYDAFLREIEQVRAEFGDRLTILAGAEVDYNSNTVREVERFITNHEFDFIIGSVHYTLSGEIIFPEYFAGRTLDDVFLPYYAEILRAIETGWFDTIGHLDLPKRYAPATHQTYDPARYRPQLDEIFAALIRQNISFEINTSGLRQPPKTSMPGPAIVQWYVNAGGTLITTGTDSHTAQAVGTGLAKTLDMLELCGIDSISAFRNRERRQIPIAQLRQDAARRADEGR